MSARHMVEKVGLARLDLVMGGVSKTAPSTFLESKRLLPNAGREAHVYDSEAASEG